MKLKNSRGISLTVLLLGALIIPMVMGGCHEPGFEVVYPVFAPEYAYAAGRHVLDSRWGTIGTVGTPTIEPVFGADHKGRLKLSYQFQNPVVAEFVGMSFAFGRPAIDVANPDGTAADPIDLHRDGAVNLRDFMATDNVSIEKLRVVFGNVTTAAPLALKFELKDGDQNTGFVRRFVSANAQVDIPLSSITGVNLEEIKVITLLVEEVNIADNVNNSLMGSFEVVSVSLVDSNAESAADAETIADLGDREMLEEFARREFESLLRLRDAKTGATLDRTLFRDLIHWGSTGWLLAALPQAVDSGWIGQDEAIAVALQILRFADNDAIFGNAEAGMLGNSVGLFYRFGGIDATGLDGDLTGTRKIDVGNVNAVEASVIDTGIFAFGAATCAAGLGDDNSEIRTRVQSILDRIDWDALVEPNSGQFFLSWKPTTGPGFTAPAAFGGFWASNMADEPLTLDFYTDEALLVAVLAAGADSDLASTWYALIRQDKDGAIVTFPGAWFTYSFFTAIYMPRDLGSDNGTPPVDWRSNAQDIYARNMSILGAGILPDAVELPHGAYIAQGITENAVPVDPPFFGVRTPYSLELATGLGDSVPTHATHELRRMIQEHPQLWDPFYGLLDALHPELADFNPPAGLPNSEPLIRNNGPWIQQQVFPLNKGAGLLALLNRLHNGAIAETAWDHPQIAAGLNAIYEETP